MQKPRVKKGIAYFQSWQDAKEFASIHASKYPEHRIIEYGLGWAVQTRPSGDYFGPDGRPSMEGK